MSTDVPLQLETVVQRAPGITFEPFDNEWLAIDGAAGFCYSLNETAGRVWAQIEAPSSIRAVARQVCAQYAVEAAACEADVLSLVEQMREYRLVQVVAPPG
jgi:hypothetical protein